MQNVLLKKLHNLHPSILTIFNKILNTGNIPKPLLQGKTILLQKKQTSEFDPNNYRPITCLSNVWKTLSCCLSNKIYDHLTKNKILPNEQKGCIRQTLGTIDQLLIDKAVTKYAKEKKVNQHVAWVDFRKAYDSLSHEWTFKCLHMFGVASNSQKLLLHAFSCFETEITFEDINIGHVKIKRGIYQGDSLSPLLFILALAPLSKLLNNEEMGFKVKVNNNITQLSHLLFVDDIKIYASSKKNLKNLLHLTEQYGQTVGLDFGYQKCALATTKHGNKASEDAITLSTGTIDPLQQEQLYKYLGIFQDTNTNCKSTKASLESCYLSKVEMICKSMLTGKNVMEALNTLAVPVLTYGAAVLQWTDEELQSIDRKTRKLLTANGIFHKNSCTERLYAKRSDGGRGLINIKNAINKQENKTWENIEKRSSGDAVLEITTYLTFNENVEPDKTHIENHIAKPLHGQFLREQQHTKNAFSWLKTSFMFKEIESLVFAVQEQCIPTHYYNAKILKMNTCEKCRLCNAGPESVQHILSNCSVLAKTRYVERHNVVGRKVYNAFLKAHNAQCDETNKDKLFEDEHIKIMWDWPIRTNKTITANRPDMLYINKKHNTCTLIDFSLPWDSRVDEKYNEKVAKYIELANEIKQLWNIRTVAIQPIIIGCLGTYTNRMKKDLENLHINLSMTDLQLVALNESCKIVRQFINL